MSAETSADTSADTSTDTTDTDTISAARTRREHDLIGDLDVPTDAHWGAHTARAVENVPISGTTLATQPYFVAALATVKQAAAVANRDVGELPDHLADAIVAACEDIRGGALYDQFVVDLIQGARGPRQT